MPSNHLILCCPHLLSSILPSIRVFSSESVLYIRWPSIGVSASASVLPTNIQDWFPLGLSGLISLPSNGLMSLLQHHSLKASILQCSAFFMVCVLCANKWLQGFSCFIFLTCNHMPCTSNFSNNHLTVMANMTHVVVQLLSHVQLFPTPWTAAWQASVSSTISCSVFKFMSFESIMFFNHVILCSSLLLLSSIFPSVRIFLNESALPIRWPKYWSLSFSISHMLSSAYYQMMSYLLPKFNLGCLYYL